MIECRTCGRAIRSLEEGPALRSEGALVHPACAPAELLASATEEYRAIVRKGLRYFVEKYSAPSDGEREIATTFVELGSAIERELARRAPGPP